ncbi:MAG: hypothetical protein QOE82_3838 [Thermoanaerobaculia bacterium]|jgi:hypothetical protein|nr:hypothetical protein [Thermoanaerobaculia bacterium]
MAAEPPPARLLVERSAIALALLFLLAVHAGVIVALINRPLDLDESEQMQVSIMLARGERMYKDFAEHHSPLFGELLSTFAPTDSGEEAIDLYVVRARALSALFGTIAIAAAAVIVWRASGHAYSAIIFVSLILSRPWLWGRAFTEVRAEPPSLALWCLGTALVLLPKGEDRRGAMLRGFGVGLVAQACLWNPKWPVASLVVGLIFLFALVRQWRISRGNVAIAVTIAIAVAASGLAVIAVMTDLRSYLGNTFGQTRALVQWSRMYQVTHTANPPIPWQNCPSLFLLPNVIPATAIVLFGVWSQRRSVRNARLVWSLLAIAAAVLIEIRFVYPYPALWIQYFILWSIVSAAIFALVPQVVLALLERLAPRSAIMRKPAVVTLTLLALLLATNLVPLRLNVPDPNTLSTNYLRARLGPGDTVWMDMTRFPLGAHTASYYWFGFHDVVPAALQWAQTADGAQFLPPLRETDLPPCRLERGLEPHLRFIASGKHYDRLPVVADCFRRLEARGLIAPTPFADVYAVVRPAAR